MFSYRRNREVEVSFETIHSDAPDADAVSEPLEDQVPWSRKHQPVFTADVGPSRLPSHIPPFLDDNTSSFPWTRKNEKEKLERLHRAGIADHVSTFHTNPSTTSPPVSLDAHSLLDAEPHSDTIMESDDGFLDFEGDSDVDMQENPRSASPIRETYPGAAQEYGEGFDTLQGVENHDMYPEERKTNLYYPFLDADDFAMAAWLNESGASMSHIDEFLKMPMVSQLIYFSKFALMRIFRSRKRRNYRSRAPRKCTTT